MIFMEPTRRRKTFFRKNKTRARKRFRRMVTRTVSVIKLNSFVYDFFWDERREFIVRRKSRENWGKQKSSVIFLRSLFLRPEQLRKLRFSASLTPAVRGPMAEKCVRLTLLGSWFAWSVDRNFDCFGVGGDLNLVEGADNDGDRERLSAAAATDEPQVVEFGHLVLHHGCVVAKLSAPVLVVSGFDRDDCVVRNVVQSDDFEGTREAFVRSPVIRQHGAQNRGRTGGD